VEHGLEVRYLGRLSPFPPLGITKVFPRYGALGESVPLATDQGALEKCLSGEVAEEMEGQFNRKRLIATIEY
jgi:hypothetical protein